jgi:hypothetical protein
MREWKRRTLRGEELDRRRDSILLWHLQFLPPTTELVGVAMFAPAISER